MKKILTAGALAAIAVVGAATANAGTNAEDAVFLGAVHQHGIVHTAGDQSLVQVGHLVCAALENGYSTSAVIDGVEFDAPKMSHGDLEFLVQTSAVVYCPDYQQ